MLMARGIVPEGSSGALLAAGGAAWEPHERTDNHKRK